MQLPSVTINDVFREVKSLKNKKCNVNDFLPAIIKENAHLIASPMAYLLNQSLKEGKFPQLLKCANVTPIYKKGSKHDMNNYRPISLLNIFFLKSMKDSKMVFS